MPQLGQYPLFIITSPYVKSLLQVVHLYDNDLWQLGHALSSIFNGDEHIGHVILEEFFASLFLFLAQLHSFSCLLLL